MFPLPIAMVVRHVISDLAAEPDNRDQERSGDAVLVRSKC